MDVEQLHALPAAYGPVLRSAVNAVTREVGLTPSSRVKNTGTIIEKLHRNGGHTLGLIHDLGGMRLVVDGGRIAQDQVAAQVCQLFADEVRAPRVIDRRAQPVEGYRAVHVIIYPDGYPIEVQIRTEWQHLCAEWFERLADQYRRGIRYGAPPTSGGETAPEIVRSMIQMADQIAEAEATNSMPPPGAVLSRLIDSVLDWLRTRGPEQ